MRHLLLTCCLAVALTACRRDPSPEDRAELEDVVTDLLVAAQRGDGEGLAELIAPDSFSDCGNLRRLALHAERAQLRLRRPVERVAVCALRRQLSYETLESASCRELFVRLNTREPWAEIDTPPPDLHDIALTRHDEATASFSMPHGDAELAFQRERGHWRIQLDSLADIVDAQLVHVERQRGQSIEEMTTELVGALSFGLAGDDPLTCDRPTSSHEL